MAKRECTIASREPRSTNAMAESIPIQQGKQYVFSQRRSIDAEK